MSKPSAKNPLRVLLVDDSPIIRLGLRSALEDPGVVVSESAADLDAAPLPCLFLRKLTVQAFRGIGGRMEVDFEPAPGLTVFAGRNGSGKSSLAEALEIGTLEDVHTIIGPDLLGNFQVRKYGAGSRLTGGRVIAVGGVAGDLPAGVRDDAILIQPNPNPRKPNDAICFSHLIDRGAVIVDDEYPAIPEAVCVVRCPFHLFHIETRTVSIRNGFPRAGGRPAAGRNFKYLILNDISDLLPRGTDLVMSAAEDPDARIGPGGQATER